MKEGNILCHGEHRMPADNFSAPNSMFFHYFKLLIRELARFLENMRRSIHLAHIMQRGLYADPADERFFQAESDSNYTAIFADSVDMVAGVVIVGFCRPCKRINHVFNESRIFKNSGRGISVYLQLFDLVVVKEVVHRAV